MTTRIKFDMAKAWVTWATVGFGVVVYALFEPTVAPPLGFVWGVRSAGGRKNRSHFDVWGSYVLGFARRQGVRRRINEEILRVNDVVTTPSGTRDGRAFMRATGYRYDPRIDLWWKARAKPRKIKRRKKR